MPDSEKNINTETSLSALQDEVAKKPTLGIFAGVTAAPFAVLIGLLAIFLPREFDKLAQDISEAEVAAISADSSSKAALVAAKSAQEGTELILAKIEGLRESIAQMDASQVYCAGDKFKSLSNSVASGFARILPPDLFASFCNSDVSSSFRYSNFDGEDWVYISEADFIQLNSDLQAALEDTFNRRNINFEITQ